MTFQELFSGKKFQWAFNQVDEFTKRKLEAYNKKVEEVGYPKRSKEIFDAVWGNIEFSAGEMCVLDSPLLQRLRKVKQLGLAYFVYCGSDYSRFYHTTGVVYLADRMAASLNRAGDSILKRKDYFKTVVRLAAIFHDTGHMFFSHASEHYFGKSPNYPNHEKVVNMLEEFERAAGREVALHELLSCMIVNTTEVRNLIKIIAGDLKSIDINSEAQLTELLDYISGLVVGVPIDGDVLPYSNIINGAIDADKCDYLSRDSHVTKVPVAVDISRLTQKLNVVKVKDITKTKMWKTSASTSGPYYELAMSDSAEKALFQLCIARTIMFDSVYYHHKVLTAETELRSLINELANLKEPLFTSFTEILEYVDEDFNQYFFEYLKMSRKQEDGEVLDDFVVKWNKLCDRQMAKRIVCIMPEYLQGTQSARENLFDEVLTCLNSKEETGLINDIKEQYLFICQLLSVEVDKDDEVNVHIIQAPNALYGHSKIRVPIALNNDKQRQFKGYELVSSRETSSSTSYFVSDVVESELMYLAIEKVLFEKYKVLLEKECGACGKYNYRKMQSYHINLIEKGYYSNAVQLIWDEALEYFVSTDELEELEDKFKSYEGPDGYTIGMSELKKFFKQIIGLYGRDENCDMLTDGIVRMLRESIVVDRKFITRSLKAIAELEESVVVPLGSGKDSAKHMIYFFNDIKKGNIETDLSLEKALEDNTKSTIVFFDDGSYSGRQMVSIIQEYMGVPQKDRATQEKHVNSLNEKACERLKEVNIIFWFLLFNSEKEEEIKEQLSDLGIVNVKFIYAQDMKDKLFDEMKVFKNEEQKEQVKVFLEDVGYQIMKSSKSIEGEYKDGWSEERAREASLGYNDSQQMVFLKSSVPTYTITAFWQRGKYKDIEWEPLFRRTLK